MKREWIRPLFVVAGIYDFVLGLVYLLAYKPIFGRFGVGLPNHPGYVQLNALFVTIMGVGFWMVANAVSRLRPSLPLLPFLPLT